MMSSNLNTLADLSNTGMTAAILSINAKNYEINKENLGINKQILVSSNNDDLLRVLLEISENQKRIIELLENNMNKGVI